MASQTFGINPTAMPAGAIVVPVGGDLQSLVNAAPAGSTFWIQAGEHRMQSVTPKDNDHFIGEQGAVLNGSRLLTNFSQEGSNWVASGQTQEGDRRATDQGAPGAERAGYPETFFIDDKPLTPVDSLAKVAPGKFYFDYAADKIYFQDNPAGHKVEAGVSPFAISGPAKGVVVENLVVEKYDSPTQFGAIGWDASAKGWTVQNNEVRLNYGVGIYAGADSTVKGNYVHDNGEMGLGGNGNNILITGNEISHNGYFAGISPGWEGGGAKFSQTDHLTVSNNYSHDNNGYGLWTDIDNINTLYEGNTVTNNLAGGISHEISYAATIRNNVVTGNGSDSHGNWLWGGGIQIQNSKDVDVYGNHVDATGGSNGITLIQQDRGSGAYGAHTTTGNHVHDNVIVEGTPNQGKSGQVADYDQAGLNAGGNTFDNNQYHVLSTSDEHFSWNGAYSDWAQYRQQSGQDAHSTISTTIPAAPTTPEATSAAASDPVTHADPTPVTAAPAEVAPMQPVPSVDAPPAPVVAAPAASTTADSATVTHPTPTVASSVDSGSTDPGTSVPPPELVASKPATAETAPPPAPEPVPAPADATPQGHGHNWGIFGGAHPWANFFGEHHGSLNGGHWFAGMDAGWHSPNALFQHYSDMAAQAGVTGTAPATDGMCGNHNPFHHSDMGNHSGLAL